MSDKQIRRVATLHYKIIFMQCNLLNSPPPSPPAPNLIAPGSFYYPLYYSMNIMKNWRWLIDPVRYVILKSICVPNNAVMVQIKLGTIQAVTAWQYGVNCLGNHLHYTFLLFVNVLLACPPPSPSLYKSGASFGHFETKLWNILFHCACVQTNISQFIYNIRQGKTTPNLC